MSKSFAHTLPSKPSNLKRHQVGGSLIETMVGITIGLLVVLAAVGSLMVTRQGTTTVSDSYRLASAGNAAMRLIASSVRQAGAVELVQTNAGEPVSFGNMQMRGAAVGDQLVSGTEGGVGTDQLTISYEHRDPTVTRDCLGNNPGAPPLRIDNLFLVNDLELRCNAFGQEQALIGDNDPLRRDREIAVEDFQVWYWVPNPVDRTQSQRVTAAAIAAGGWGVVQAVEVCLQLRGINANYPVGNFTNCRDAAVANGGRMHQVFRGVYKIRNRI